MAGACKPVQLYFYRFYLPFFSDRRAFELAYAPKLEQDL